MARPRTHDAATAEALLDAAARLLRAGGPEAISVRAVADEVGTSFRAVYALFGSKQALVDALAERGYRSLAERVTSLPETTDPAGDLVRAGVDGFRPFALEDPEVFRLTFERVSAEVLHQEPVAAAALANYRALAQMVSRARGIGAVHHDRSDETCILSFHATCQGLASCEIAARPYPEGPGMWPMVDVDMAALWRDALTSLVAGFAEPPAVAQ
jgi:AcrR family transcriptional regulator